jgi:hypothetical protein
MASRLTYCPSVDRHADNAAPQATPTCDGARDQELDGSRGSTGNVI